MRGSVTVAARPWAMMGVAAICASNCIVPKLEKGPGSDGGAGSSVGGAAAAPDSSGAAGSSGSAAAGQSAGLVIDAHSYTHSTAHSPPTV